MDTLTSIERMNKKGISFYSITESIDTSSANGRFFLTILSSLSQLERELVRINYYDLFDERNSE